ncbi:MAG TPA: serine hydrolase domain-containing protein, partial [Anaerolineae bacterium]|nr:serine hydrolase domain-containing protein [Anaerolineae bacterium]
MSLSCEIESLARETMEKFHVPGMAILAARANAEPNALLLGVDAAGVAVSETSFFNIASITKLATALCVLRLVESGQLELDHSLATYVPDAQAAQDGVTLRTLLCHISGLPLDLAHGAELYGKPMTTSDMLRECLGVPLKIPPRTRVVYSNVGYGLLAVVVERVTRRKFSDVLREQVLDPLRVEGYLGKEPPRLPMKLADIRSRHAG